MHSEPAWLHMGCAAQVVEPAGITTGKGAMIGAGAVGLAVIGAIVFMVMKKRSKESDKLGDDYLKMLGRTR